MTATDVGNRRAQLQLLDDTLKRWQPFLHQMMFVTGSEEACRSAEQAFVPLVPADALAGLERRGNFWLVEECRRHQAADSSHEYGAVLVGENQILFRRHREFSRYRVVFDISRCRLGGE